MTERAREATEYTKERSEELFGNYFDVMCRAVYVNARVRAAKRWRMEKRVKVYDHEDCTYRVKEAELESVRRQSILNNG